MTEHRPLFPSAALYFLLRPFGHHFDNRGSGVRFPFRGQENVLGFGLPGYPDPRFPPGTTNNPLIEPTSDQGKSIRSGELVFPPYLPGQFWKDASKKLFYGCLIDYHNDPTINFRPSQPDGGDPPPGQDRQYKFDLNITYCTFCEEMKELIDLLGNSPPAWLINRFTGGIWSLFDTSDDGKLIQDPQDEKDRIYNLFILNQNKLGYRGNINERKNDIYKNLTGLLQDLYKEFCPCDPSKELPDLSQYALFDIDGVWEWSERESTIISNLEPKWRRGRKIKDEHGNEGIHYSPPEGSPTPFYGPNAPPPPPPPTGGSGPFGGFGVGLIAP